jgi:hypothetical protein
VLYGKRADFLEVQRKKVELANSRDWAAASFWESSAGRVNDFFLEREYPTLGDLARELEAREADYEFMRLMRASYPLVVQGSIVVEIFESVDPASAL